MIRQSRWSATRPRQLAQMALLLALLCAFAVQQGLARTHWHAAATVAAVSDPPQGNDGDHGNEGRQHDCLACQIAAHAAAAAPPSGTGILLPAPAPVFRLLPAGHEFPPASAPAHAWQSRGPPGLI